MNTLKKFPRAATESGGRVGSSLANNYLRSLMLELGAVDLGFFGARYTWCNKRWGHECIRERLDHGIANVQWRTEFPRATVLHLGAVNFDHCHCLLTQILLMLGVLVFSVSKLCGPLMIDALVL